MNMYGVGYDEHGPAYPVGAAVKVGDKIRVVKDGRGNEGSHHGLKVGAEDTVRALMDDGVIMETRWYLKWNEFEPVAPALPEPKFKVGDRVSLINDNFGGRYGRAGDTGEILHLEGGNADVCFDTFRRNGESAWFVPVTNLRQIPTFSPNDRLRLKRHTATLAAGDNVIVSETDTYGVYATDINGRSHYIVNEHLEHAPDCAERKVEQGETEPKFRAGDRVRSLKFPQYVYTIARVKTEYSAGEPYDGPTAYDYASTTGWDLESSIELDPAAAPSAPAIVALMSKGKPRPSQWPHVHANTEDATVEAERLAKNNPGQEFAVFQRVTARVCEVSYSMKEVA